MLVIKSESYCGLCGKDITTLLKVVNETLMINCIPCNGCMETVIKKATEQFLISLEKRKIIC
jgi:hypothetical protein